MDPTQAQQVAPDDSAEPQAPEPQQEQPGQAEAAATPVAGRKPTWGAADTQAAQDLAAIKKELGLPKNARFDTVLEALNNARQPQSARPDYDTLDPVVAASLQQRDEQLWAMAEDIHGPEVRDAAWELWELAAKSDPFTFFKAYTASIERVTEAPGESDGGQSEPDQQQPQAGMPDLGNADVPLAPRQITNADPTGGRANTGDFLGFVKEQMQRVVPR